MSQPRIIAVGLGSGDPDQLTLGVWRKLQSASAAGTLRVRTATHPAVRRIEAEGLVYRAYDDIYETHDRFEDVYETIAASLIDEAPKAPDAIVYAVPGHPMVAERTVQLLRERCPAAGIAFEIAGGESFLDQAFVRLGFDPIEGFQLLDAASLKPDLLRPELHTLIGQVYDAMTASDVKLALMELYPDDYEVVAGHALGVPGEERIDRVPLYELDRLPHYGNLSLVWVPRTDNADLRVRRFERLREIVEILRSPEGCPWDREQTHESLRKHLIEETYEVLDAIGDDDPDAMCEELGDLLLQVMLHAQIEAETGAFTVYDVIAGLNEKLIRRHPHVFGERKAADAEEALSRWQAMKAAEKAARAGTGRDEKPASALDGVPRELPSLYKALKLQKKAAAVGFDWPDAEGVFAKVEEELAEVREARASGDSERVADELGDLLFAIVNLARFVKADPDAALERTNRKFVKRFSYMEEQLRLRGKKLENTSLEEMESYWQAAKKLP
ncbi:nucleoside triphosphate pyrophosphohydrolase [Paenibacillus thermoaerophilus]|uniref:Nucleoside triphosphate pyrophosphohydrolase n=1 Tax=Paenibacillus thermoaerophilus TaxID=1215385 RepID=A0ABW2UYI1_9BACL|nr:nucleoside triphosphate pyrophosphohydrolase [Paenibacillus thermoaerophilus]TMV09456.1 nucleoside triphosphate pyrophosphohydrolase [Paenibacillus thermoaerophilus]